MPLIVTAQASRLDQFWFTPVGVLAPFSGHLSAMRATVGISILCEARGTLIYSVYLEGVVPSTLAMLATFLMSLKTSLTYKSHFIKS